MKKHQSGLLMKRKDLKSWIDNHTWPTMVFLAQLYLFPQGNRIYWRKAVWEKFSTIYPLKKSGKLPSVKFILNSGWNMNRHRVSAVLQYAQDKCDEYTPLDGTTYDEFYEIVNDYFTWLADKLSQQQQISLQEVKSELDSLGLEEIDLRVQNR